MKIQKLEAKIAAGICTDADITAYLTAEALKPIIAAENRYDELKSTPDKETKPEVTDTRTIIVTPAVYDGQDGNGEYTLVSPAVTEEEAYIVSEAIDYNAIRDDEISQLETDFPHLVEPEQTYTTKTDEYGNETVTEDVMPTRAERRPVIEITDEQKIPFLAKSYLQKVSIFIDNKAKQLGYDSIDSTSKYGISTNSFTSEAKTFSEWAAACWDKCYELLAIGQIITEEELFNSLPELQI